MTINSYPSLYALGKREVLNIFDDYVLIEEKIDGSQISFGMINGQLQIRSRGQNINLEEPVKIFQLATNYLNSIKHLLTPGWIYRGECLSKEKHNVLKYDRTPKNNIIIYDIQMELGYCNTFEVKKCEAEKLGLEVCPLIFEGQFDKFEINKLLDRKSILGDIKIEGIVIKNYSKLIQGKPMITKLVSDDFKEVAKHPKKLNKKSRDEFIDSIGERYRTKARWNKAIQHLKEAGLITYSMKDIGTVIREVIADVQKECEDEIKQALFDEFYPKIKTTLIRGFPDYYKDILKGELNE